MQYLSNSSITPTLVFLSGNKFTELCTTYNFK